MFSLRVRDELDKVPPWNFDQDLRNLATASGFLEFN